MATNNTWNSGTLPVSVPKGGTGVATLTTAYGLLCAGTTATGPVQTLSLGTALQVLQSGGAGALPAWSTATYPATTTINRILYSSANNVVNQIATANSGLLVTDGSGIPSIGTDIPNGVTATTQAPGTNNTTLATTAYVDAAVAAGGGGGWTGFSYISNRYYHATDIGHSIGTLAASVMTTGTLFYFPFYCSKTTTFIRIAVRVTAGSGGTNVNMGIYASSNGAPTGGPLANSTSGSVSSATTGTTASYTFGTPIELDGMTLYWLACTCSSSTPTFAKVSYSATNSNPNMMGEATFDSANNQIIGWTQAFAYNTTLPTAASLSANADSSNVFLVGLQAQ